MACPCFAPSSVPANFSHFFHPNTGQIFLAYVFERTVVVLNDALSVVSQLSLGTASTQISCISVSSQTGELALGLSNRVLTFTPYSTRCGWNDLPSQTIALDDRDQAALALGWVYRSSDACMFFLFYCFVRLFSVSARYCPCSCKCTDRYLLLQIRR